MGTPNTTLFNSTAIIHCTPSHRKPFPTSVNHLNRYRQQMLWPTAKTDVSYHGPEHTTTQPFILSKNFSISGIFLLYHYTSSESKQSIAEKIDATLFNIFLICKLIHSHIHSWYIFSILLLYKILSSLFFIHRNQNFLLFFFWWLLMFWRFWVYVCRNGRFGGLKSHICQVTFRSMSNRTHACCVCAYKLYASIVFILFRPSCRAILWFYGL